MEICQNPGYLVALFVVVADLLPVMISFLLLWDGKTTKKITPRTLIAIVLCAGIHLSSYMLIHKVFFDHWNFLNVIRDAIALDFTYQEIMYFPVSLAARAVMGLFTGGILRILGTAEKNRPARLSPKCITALYSLLLTVGIAVICTCHCCFSGLDNIVINEIGNYNVNVTVDAEGTVCDYIELYNKGNLACMVEDVYLSDQDTDLKMKEIDPSVIPAHGYLVVKLEDSSLKLTKSGGETVFLSNVWGRILDQSETVEVESDFSFSRVNDAADRWQMRSATPGMSNSEGIARLGTIPVLSHSSGFYEDDFELQISADEGLQIYYTLDGSLPSTESARYTQPIRIYNRSDEPNVWRSQQRVVLDWQKYTPDPTPVDKAFVVRAIAADENGAVSKPVTATYFVGLNEYREDTVVSLIVDPDDFWGENGIYVTGKKYDDWYLGDRTGEEPTANFRKWGSERPAYFQYFSEDKSFGQDIGIRVTGQSTRNFAKKNVSLYSRERYSGSEIFEQNIFQDLQSRKLAVRGGFAHAFCQMLVRDRNFGTQQSQRVSVFLNGEFWYDANILEKYDSLYFYEHFGINPNNIVSVEEREYLDNGKAGDELLLNEVYDYLADHNLSDDAHYTGFAELVDIQSYIDYMCFNIYIDNMDFSESKNCIWWRSREKTYRPYEDGKWRFLLYDLDAMEWDDAHLWGLETQAEKNSFTLIPRYNNDQTIDRQPLFVALKENPSFVQRFVLTFMDMVNTNFRYENVKNILDSYGPAGDDFQGTSQDIRYYETFFETRAEYIVPYMAKEFALTGTLAPLYLQTNDSQGGSVRLNTIVPDLSGGKWSGQYYTDFPVTVTAVPEEGYVFKGWSGSLDSAEESVEVKLNAGGTLLYAVFEKEIP